MSKIDIYPMLEISTCHITNETCNVWLKDDECPICAYEFDYGWFIPVPNFDHLDPDEFNDTPKDLIDCLDFAKKHKCTYIKFDCDALTYDELPKYDW